VRQQVGDLDSRVQTEQESLRDGISMNQERASKASGEASKATETAGGARQLALGHVDHAEIQLNSVQFAFESDELSESARAALDQVAATLDDNPNYIVELHGHTDTTGPESYNEALSRRRAYSVLRYLVEQTSLPLERFSMIGHGEFALLSSADGIEDREASRRVGVRVLERIEPGRPQALTEAGE
jgi:outer membrane protein OmpA-like peptidoglycan-associated protein